MRQLTTNNVFKFFEKQWQNLCRVGSHFHSQRLAIAPHNGFCITIIKIVGVYLLVILPTFAQITPAAGFQKWHYPANGSAQLFQARGSELFGILCKQRVLFQLGQGDEKRDFGLSSLVDSTEPNANKTSDKSTDDRANDGEECPLPEVFQFLILLCGCTFGAAAGVFCGMVSAERFLTVSTGLGKENSPGQNCNFLQ